MNPGLEERARAWGVATGYWDAAGEWRTPSEDTVERILALMGADGGDPPPSPIRIVRVDRPERLGPGVIETEDEGSVPVEDETPPDLPVGYHRFVDREGSARTLIVSPGACFLPASLRAWGWAIQLYSMRSKSSWGIGDLGDLKTFSRWAARGGAGMVMINPLHAPKPGPRPQPSPYLPGSRLFRSPLYLAIEDLPGAADAGLDLERLATEGRKLNDDPRIDRSAAHRLKTEALKILWHRPQKEAEPDSFRREIGPALDRYATYLAIAELEGPDWARWSAEFQRPDSPAVDRLRAGQADRVGFHRWVQWLIDRQLAGAAKETMLVGDLAVGAAPDGADAWMWQDAFVPDVSAGAPPDEFNRRGQDWGALAWDPWRLRAAGYAPFIDVVRAALRHFSGVRIDHVMGLWRLFWVPAGEDPSSGTYVTYPASDLLDILAVESHRARSFIIGEDLGTVEPQVRAEMTLRNLLAYRLAWFEEEPPASYPEPSLAAITNHDLPTVRGLWTEADTAIQRELGMEPDEAAEAGLRERVMRITALGPDASVEEISHRLYGLLAESPAMLVAATLEDALGVARRPNYPGTMDTANWSRALPRTLEEITSDPQVAGLARALSSSRRKIGDG
ncbi:MAG: 4-alpha-glucanotransferase [Actinomycetota bacterium]